METEQVAEPIREEHVLLSFSYFILNFRFGDNLAITPLCMAFMTQLLKSWVFYKIYLFFLFFFLLNLFFKILFSLGNSLISSSC